MQNKTFVCQLCQQEKQIERSPRAKVCLACRTFNCDQCGKETLSENLRAHKGSCPECRAAGLFICCECGQQCKHERKKGPLPTSCEPCRSKHIKKMQRVRDIRQLKGSQEKTCPECNKNFVTVKARHMFCTKKCENTKHLRSTNERYNKDEEFRNQQSEYHKKRRNTDEYRKKNNEQQNARYATQEGRDKRRFYNDTRRATQLKAEGTYTQEDFRQICERFNHICPACGSDKQMYPDHMLPITVGGTNWPDNIQPLCKSCNSSKGNRRYEKFAPWNGQNQTLIEFIDFTKRRRVKITAQHQL